MTNENLMICNDNLMLCYKKTKLYMLGDFNAIKWCMNVVKDMFELTVLINARIIITIVGKFHL